MKIFFLWACFLPLCCIISAPAQESFEKKLLREDTERLLRKSDVILTVALYRFVRSETEETYYGRVVESLRGDIPVEALVQFSFKRPLRHGAKPEIRHKSAFLMYVLASSKNITPLKETDPETQEDDEVTGRYIINPVISYFPKTESDPGRMVTQLLRIIPAAASETSSVIGFHPDE